MDTVSRYREIVRDLIQYYAQFKPSHGEIDTEVVIDDRNGHYELMHSGWTGTYRVHGSVIHIDIRDGKVLLQWDGTDECIAEKLVEAGIPRDRIVLAFKHPDVRPHTGFAVA